MTAEGAQALDCVFDEDVELVLEERLVDGEPMESELIGSSASIFGSDYGLTVYLVGQEESFDQDRCSSLGFENPEAP